MGTDQKRESSPDVVRLRALIDMLVDVVREHGGESPGKGAKIIAARRAGISVSEMDYVVTSAVADRRVEYSLRTGRISLLERCE